MEDIVTKLMKQFGYVMYVILKYSSTFASVCSINKNDSSMKK